MIDHINVTRSAILSLTSTRPDRITLPITQNNVTDVSDAQTIHKDISHRYFPGYLGRFTVQFQDIAGLKNKDIFFLIPKFSREGSLGFQVTILSVHGNCILWFNQRVD